MNNIMAKTYVSMFISILAGAAWILSKPMPPAIYGWLIVCPLAGFVAYAILTTIERAAKH